MVNSLLTQNPPPVANATDQFAGEIAEKALRVLVDGTPWLRDALDPGIIASLQPFLAGPMENLSVRSIERGSKLGHVVGALLMPGPSMSDILVVVACA